MNHAEKARLLACVDDMLELVESDIRDDSAEWSSRIDRIAQRRDGSLEGVVRLLSQWASITTIALAGATQTPMGQALADARVALVQWIDDAP